MAGSFVDGNVVNNQAFNYSQQIRSWVDGIKNFKRDLDELDDNTATNTLQISSADLAILRASITDLSNFALIYDAQRTQAALNDFDFNARHLRRFR